MNSKSDENGDDGPRREPEVEEAFSRLVSEGSNRLDRPLVPLLATGFVGGIDVGVGVLAYLVVYHETGQPLLAAAAGTAPGGRGTRRSELGLLLLLQHRIGELEQVRTGQHGQGVDGEPGRPRQVDVARRQAGRDP